MLAKVFGWFWIGIGIFFLVKPNILKQRLGKKSVKKLRRLFFAIAIVVSYFLFTISWRMEGVISKVIMFLSIILIFKGIFFLKAKVAEIIIDWVKRQPLIFFRFSALIYIGLGIIILYIGKF